MDLYKFLSINFSHTKDQLKRVRFFSAEEFGSLMKWIKDVLKAIELLRNEIINNKPSIKDSLEKAFNQTFDEWLFDSFASDECLKKSNEPKNWKS